MDLDRWKRNENPYIRLAAYHLSHAIPYGVEKIEVGIDNSFRVVSTTGSTAWFYDTDWYDQLACALEEYGMAYAIYNEWWLTIDELLESYAHKEWWGKAVQMSPHNAIINT